MLTLVIIAGPTAHHEIALAVACVVVLAVEVVTTTAVATVRAEWLPLHWLRAVMAEWLLGELQKLLER